MDTSDLGTVAAEMMELIAEDYPGCELGVVAVVAEVTNHEEEWTAIQHRCSDGRHWTQTGLFRAALRAVGASHETLEGD